MSFVHLINTVSDKLGMSEDQSTINLFNFMDRIGYKSFSLKKLNQLDYAIDLVNILIEFGILMKVTNYTCLKIGESDNTYFEDVKCKYCNSLIVQDKDSHEINIYYKYSDKIKGQALFDYLNNKLKEIDMNQYLMKDYIENFEELKENLSHVVPLIGSGMSKPFGLPVWSELLINLEGKVRENDRDGYLELVREGDYMEALSFLKQHSLLRTDKQVQGEISRTFKKNLRLNIPKLNHNYFDLLSLEFSNYLTTNYDNILYTLQLQQKLQGYTPQPILWSEIEDAQNLFLRNKGQLVHLHGMIHKESSMIVTKESYENLYNNPNYTETFMMFMSNKSLLFIGFSLNDKFFVDLYRKVISKIGGTHYLIAPNVSFRKAQKFAEDNIKVIGINVKTTADKYLDEKDFVKSIRSVLKAMKN
ncbi:SIR2 family protein [Bacillus sp. S34]|nr:SIR2 family protein [Bacillus sp. S34]